MSSGMQDEFTDVVTDFGTDGDRITVLFARQAAGYHLPVGADDLARHVSALADSWKNKRPVAVVVEGTRIVSVKSTGDRQPG